MEVFDVVGGKRYHPDSIVRGIKVMYTVMGKGYVVETSCEDGAEIAVMFSNIVPPSAYQLRILSVTE